MERELLRKVQLTQLEIAKELKRVCDENNIRYFLNWGSYLGAVRHKGFIPWDDDMDFGMLREDYDKFRQIAPEKLGPGYCFQDWHTDENYALPFGKVRKRDTVYVEAKCARLPENGVYIDIFPLDYAPREQKDRDALNRKLLHLFRVKLMLCGYTPWMEEDKVVWKKRIGYLLYQFAALFTNQKAVREKYEALFRAVPKSDTLYDQQALPYAIYFSEKQCTDLVEYAFEDTTFAGRRDYDGILTGMYGDYMQPPPEDKRENTHQIMEIDLGENS